MKRYLALFALLAATLSASAQITRDEALVDDLDKWNLYTKLGASLCEIGSDDGIWGTVEAGVILNDKLAFGLRGTTLLDDVDPGFSASSSISQLDALYGGLNLEYTFSAESLIHWSLGLFAGLGSVEISDYRGADVDVVVLQPALNGYINISQTVEAGLGLAYRYMTPDGEDELDEGDFSGVELSVLLRLTEF